MEIGYDRVADWAEHKRRVEDDLIARLEAVIPGVSSHIVTRQSASALTSWRFTLNLQGAMLGWEMSPEQLGDKRPPIDCHVRNLYLCGHCGPVAGLRRSSFRRWMSRRGSPDCRMPPSQPPPQTPQ
jgi:phytoene dehydrogenase-like protein